MQEEKRSEGSGEAIAEAQGLAQPPPLEWAAIQLMNASRSAAELKVVPGRH